MRPIAIGSNAAPATGTGDQTIEFGGLSKIPEPGFTYLGRLVLTDQYKTGAGYGKTISVGGDQLAYGFWPLAAFAADANLSPNFGHRVDRNTNIEIVVNRTVTGGYLAHFHTLPEDAAMAIAQQGRSYVIQGQAAAPAAVAAAGTGQVNITFKEAGQLSRLVFDDIGGNGVLDCCVATSATFKGKTLFVGNVPLSQFKAEMLGQALWREGVRNTDTLTIDYTNHHATLSATVVAGALVMGGTGETRA